MKTILYSSEYHRTLRMQDGHPLLSLAKEGVALAALPAESTVAATACKTLDHIKFMPCLHEVQFDPVPASNPQLRIAKWQRVRQLGTFGFALPFLRTAGHLHKSWAFHSIIQACSMSLPPRERHEESLHVPEETHVHS